MSASTVRKDLSFAQIPEWVLFHEQLSAQAVRLYAVLARYADKDGQAYPSRATLAGHLGVKSLDTVDRATKELLDHHAVTVEQRFDAAGDRTSNMYTVHLAPPEGVAARMRPPTPIPAATGGRTEAARGGRTGAATVAAQIVQELEPFEVEPLTPSGRGDKTSPRSTEQPPSTPTSTAAVHAPEAQQRGDTVTPRPRCPKHSTLHSNCRGCGTTARQLEEQRRRLDAARRREADQAAAAAERQARATRDAADPELIDRTKAIAAAARGGGA